MANLTIRQLNDEAHARLKARARANRRSLEAEARLLLEEGSRSIEAIVADLESFHHQMVAKHGYLPDSVELVRENRRDP